MTSLSREDQGTDLKEDFEARNDRGVLVAYCAVKGRNLPPIHPGEGRSVLLAGQTGLGSDYARDRMGMRTKTREIPYAPPEVQARRVLARYQASLGK